MKPTKGNLFGLTVDREKIQILDLRVVYPPDFYSWTNWRCPPQESPRISRELIAPVKAGRGNSLIRFMTIIKGQNRKPSDLCLAFQIRFPSHSMAKGLPRASRASRHRASLSFCKAGNRHVNALLWPCHQAIRIKVELFLYQNQFLDRTKNSTGFQSIRFQCFEQSWDEFGVKKSGGVSSGELIWLPFASGFENNSRSQGVIFFWIVALYFHNGVQSAGLLQDLQIDRWAYAAQPFHILWKILLFPKKWPNPPYLF